MEKNCYGRLCRQGFQQILYGMLVYQNGLIVIDATRTSAICIENVRQQDQIVGLRCLHVFHSTCLNQVALSGFRKCPLCQRPIIPMSGEARCNLSEDDAKAAQSTDPARIEQGIS